MYYDVKKLIFEWLQDYVVEMRSLDLERAKLFAEKQKSTEKSALRAVMLSESIKETEQILSVWKSHIVECMRDLSEAESTVIKVRYLEDGTWHDARMALHKVDGYKSATPAETFAVHREALGNMRLWAGLIK